MHQLQKFKCKINMTFAKRIHRELKEIKDNAPEGCKAGPIDESNIKEWRATIKGPPDTPYHEGTFTLKVIFPDNYPFSPPSVKFETPIYHPNVRDGRICLDILNKQWAPAMTLSKVLLSVIALMQEPNTHAPMNKQCATEYTDDYKTYFSKAKKMVDEHAKTKAETSQENQPAASGTQENQPAASGNQENQPTASGAQENQPATTGAQENQPAATGAQENQPAAGAGTQGNPAAPNVQPNLCRLQ